MTAPAADRQSPDDFDLAQFHGVFFEEAADNLESFERLLLDLDPANAADDTLHAIFRCAHSVKGGAATFGFADVADLTHAMETLLDRLRRHEQALTAAMVDTLLEAGDRLRAQLDAHQHGGAAPDTADVLAALHAHLGAPQAAPAQTAPAPAAPAPAAPATAGERELEMIASGLASPSLADDLLELFREVAGVGTLDRAEPDEGQAADAARFRLRTTSSDADILDLCGFHVPKDSIRLRDWLSAAASPAQPASVLAEPVEAAPAEAAPAKPARNAAASAAATETLRVSLRKVDQLINLMGELVITQAMLAQRAATLDPRARAQLVGGLGSLERTTRDLQESVMAIRMIPMGDVFNRFPRMLRDLAARLGKQVEFRTVGESTELDKGLIEKITDPLTHLVRNAVDHGIELPDERTAAGKPAQGSLVLSAKHEGGCIVIEVRDDGRGLDRERLLAKARRNGMPLPETMSDSEVYQLIFAPGFSTAEAVTDISGRGVGMDVVRRNILSLGGTVELDSQPGRGTCVRVRLPLTLAIMDGMSVSVNGELYILPLASVVESFQPQPGAVRSLTAHRRVVTVREEHVPVVALHDFVRAPRRVDGPSGRPMIVLVQAEGRTVALEVERLVGQQQIVVKNLEANWRKVPGVSGATIMGDGSVALILDVGALVRCQPGGDPASTPTAMLSGDDASSSAAGGRHSSQEAPVGAVIPN